jgi:hypothetical protein
MEEAIGEFEHERSRDRDPRASARGVFCTAYAADTYWLELTFAGGFAGCRAWDRRSPHELAIEGPAV